MPESAVSEPIDVGTDARQSAPGQPLKKQAKAFNSFQIAQAQFDKVAEYLGLDPATRDLLRYPLREFHFAIPVRMDDGSVKSSAASGCSTTTRVDRGRVVSGSIRKRRLTRSAPCRCG